MERNARAKLAMLNENLPALFFNAIKSVFQKSDSLESDVNLTRASAPKSHLQNVLNSSSVTEAKR